jgi:hypothetical protein
VAGVKPVWLPRDITAPVSDKEHEAVRIAQRAMRLEPTGELDEPTRASLRGLQRFFGLPVHGTLDAATAERIDALRPYRLGML